jgi:hypothetical protein
MTNPSDGHWSKIEALLRRLLDLKENARRDLPCSPEEYINACILKANIEAEAMMMSIPEAAFRKTRRRKPRRDPEDVRVDFKGACEQLRFGRTKVYKIDKEFGLGKHQDGGRTMFLQNRIDAYIKSKCMKD